jgi:hypothetical protein
MNLDFSAFADLIVSPVFITSWCSLIALYSCYWAISLLTKSRSLTKQLDSALRILNGPKDGEQFGVELQAIEQQLIRHADLEPAVTSLFAHFQIAPRMHQTNPKQFVESAIDPAELFNEHTIINQKIDPKLYGAIAGQLSRIGILGTFVGLSAGIYLARGALAGTDTAEMQTALTQLLGGAALDFWTSIVGVLSSIAFSRIENAALYRLRVKIQKISKVFNRLIQVSTPEKNSAFQKSALIEQTQCLKDLATEISMLNRRQSQIQADVLKDIVNQFRTALSEQAPNEMKAIAVGCQEILDVIRDGIGGLGQSSHSLLSSCQETGRVLEESLSKAADAFKDKLVEATILIETSARSAANEMSVAIVESSLCAAEQLKSPAADIAETVANLNEKTRRATDDWTDAILTVERVANLMQLTLSRTATHQDQHDQGTEERTKPRLPAGYLETKRSANRLLKRKTI